MEEKKKLNLKILPPVAVAIVALIIGIFIGIFIGMSLVNNKTNKGITEKDYIGTWKLTKSKYENWYIQTIVLYEGGTGKMFGESGRNGEYSITWELKDNVINITGGSANDTTGYKIDKITPRVMTTLDGDFTYCKE